MKEVDVGSQISEAENCSRLGISLPLRLVIFNAMVAYRLLRLNVLIDRMSIAEEILSYSGSLQ